MVITRYLVWEAPKCLGDDEFKVLMRESEDLGEDVRETLLQRTSWQEDKAEKSKKRKRSTVDKHTWLV